MSAGADRPFLLTELFVHATIKVVIVRGLLNE